MKEAFDFIRHGAAQKDLDERLTAIHYLGNKVQSWSGIVAMQHPCEKVGTFSVKSDKLMRAIEACDWEPESIKVSDNTVYIKKGRISISLPIAKTIDPVEKQKGKQYPVPEDLLDKLRLVHPFISIDASRQWSMAVHVSDGYMMATNNVIIVRTPIDMPDCTIPEDIVNILLKLKQQPAKLSMNKAVICFTFENESWLQGSLIAQPWPEFDELFKKKKKLKLIPKSLLKAVQRLKYFTDEELIQVKDKTAITAMGTYNKVKIPDISVNCFYLEKVLQCFDEADFRDPLIHLRGKNIEGVMASVMVV